jgi:hypothetical protein
MATNKSNRPNPGKNKVQNRGQTVPEQPSEESDDSIIGTMFWRSVGVLSVAAAAAVGIYFATRPSKEAGPEKKTAVIEPKQRTTPVSVSVPDIPFTDITAQSGIQFVHFNGMDSERLLPETMGGGGGFFDFDNDGDQDILLVSSTRWPWSTVGTPPKSTLSLYENDGQGNYKDVSEERGLVGSFYGMGPAFGDFNNDGWTDVFVTAVGTNHLYRNVEGKFTDVSSEMGVEGSADQWSCPAAWFDYDRDGKLDLIVGNYIKWSRDIDLSLASTLEGTTRGYGQPTNFSGAHMLLYHNDGNKFTEVSEKAGLHIENVDTRVPRAKALGIAIMDPNRDGWPDVFVANDTVARFLFVNKKDGTFNEDATRQGLALSRDGLATGAMGVDCGFLCNDVRIALGIGNFANEPSSLYVSEGQGALFSDMASATGFGPQTKIRLTFGIFFADLDLDGNQDIVCANGHLEPEIQKVQPTQQFEQPPQLFWNRGNMQLVLLDEAKTGGAFQKPMVGRGATYADIDGDGDLDILLIANGGPARLLRNDQKTGNHWLRVSLRDKKKTGAIGAIASIKIDKSVLTRCITPTRSYLSQTELTATFGLGKNTPKELDIVWSDGTKQTVPIDKVDTTMVIEQPE